MFKSFKKFLTSKQKHEENIADNDKDPVEKPTKEKTVQDYIQDFYNAKKDRNAEDMIQALQQAEKCCPHSNSYCLNEIFCPECPFGDLPVMSGRAGM